MFLDGSGFPLAIFLAFGVFAVVTTALWIWSLVDALRITDRQWETAGQNKLMWVILIAVLGVLGSLLYVVMARPALSRAAT